MVIATPACKDLVMATPTDARRQVRAATFEELKRIAIALRLTPEQLARLCRRLHLDCAALRDHVVREVLHRS
jgi:hypothetical protein